MKRTPAHPSDHDRCLTEVDSAVLALARLLGEAAARQACLETPPFEDDADAPEDE